MDSESFIAIKMLHQMEIILQTLVNLRFIYYDNMILMDQIY